MPSAFATASKGPPSNWKDVNRTVDATRHVRALSACDQAASGSRQIWESVYSKRVARLLGDRNGPPVCLFPGRSPALSIAAGCENFSLDRLRAISSSQLFVDPSIVEAVDNESPATSWKWRYIKRERFKLAVCERQRLPVLHGEVHALAKEVMDRATLCALFDELHLAWADVEKINYIDHALDIALSAVHSLKVPNILAVMLELEEFASYCTLRSRLQISESGLYDGKWIDVAYQRLDAIRASERCVSSRLLNELENIAQGQTAPLLVNEFNCVADGNHRLAASWLWNALHLAREQTWELGDLQFEKVLISFVEAQTPATTSLTIRNALEGLSFILFTNESKRRLMALRKLVSSHSIYRLPTIPVLSYCGLAIERNAFQDGGRLRRFSPEHYAILKNDHLTYLPAKACYHFADRLPLPTFSVIVQNEPAMLSNQFVEVNP